MGANAERRKQKYRANERKQSLLMFLQRVQPIFNEVKAESRKEKQRSLVATLCRDDKHAIIFTLLSVIYKTFHRPPPQRDSP